MDWLCKHTINELHVMKASWGPRALQIPVIWVHFGCSNHLIGRPVAAGILSGKGSNGLNPLFNGGGVFGSLQDKGLERESRRKKKKKKESRMKKGDEEEEERKLKKERRREEEGSQRMASRGMNHPFLSIILTLTTEVKGVKPTIHFLSII